MASDDAKFNKELDLPPDFNGRIFIVDGQKLPVKAEVLNLLVEYSEYFRTLLTSDFLETNQKEIEIKEVSAKDFKSFLNLIMLFAERAKRGKVLTGTERQQRNQLIKLVAESDVVSIILLADRFMAQGPMNLVFKFLHKVKSFAKRADLFKLIDLAFKINNEYLKKLSLFLMKQADSELPDVPDPYSAEFDKMYSHLFVTNTCFFYTHRARFNDLAPEIRAYIREKIPCVQDIINA